MVNVFGDETGRGGRPGPRGVRGPPGSKGKPGPVGLRGPAGVDGSGGIDDICRWLPASFVVEQFRRTEKACFLVRDEKKDLKWDATKGYTEWISRSDEQINATAVRPSKQIQHISDHLGALVFDNSLYKSKMGGLTPPTERTYVSLCITFQVRGADDQWLASDWEGGQSPDNFRGISASAKEIRVWGAANGDKNYMPIEYIAKRNRWTTVFVEWTTIGDGVGRFVVNDNEIHGVFACRKPGWLAPKVLSIGARLDGEFPVVNGVISAVEVYINEVAEKDVKKERGLPDALKSLIIKDQLI